jgi:PTH1 family peptidyl-tRNA hydrolase
VKSVKAAEKMVVVYDDLDLPLGVIKVSFDRGSGGHKGIESVMRAVKTKKFLRIRVGISGATPKGKLKKPLGESKVEKHILGKFTPNEITVLKKLTKKIEETLLVWVDGGEEAAMQLGNTR